MLSWSFKAEIISVTLQSFWFNEFTLVDVFSVHDFFVMVAVVSEPKPDLGPLASESQ